MRIVWTPKERQAVTDEIFLLLCTREAFPITRETNLLQVWKEAQEKTSSLDPERRRKFYGGDEGKALKMHLNELGRQRDQGIFNGEIRVPGKNEISSQIKAFRHAQEAPDETPAEPLKLSAPLGRDVDPLQMVSMAIGAMVTEHVTGSLGVFETVLKKIIDDFDARLKLTEAKNTELEKTIAEQQQELTGVLELITKPSTLKPTFAPEIAERALTERLKISGATAPAFLQQTTLKKPQIVILGLLGVQENEIKQEFLGRAELIFKRPGQSNWSFQNVDKIFYMVGFCGHADYQRLKAAVSNHERRENVRIFHHVDGATSKLKIEIRKFLEGRRAN